uniref:PDZ domain-containing protein n=1 Tax=Parascaris univalens TaxID=6257 RepID=A0A915BW30_PARUN
MFTWNSSGSSSTIHSLRSISPSTSSFGRSLLGSLTRSKLYHSLTSLDRTKMWSRFYVDDEENKVLDAVSNDQKVLTNPRLNRKRRTVIVARNDSQPFGFTIQSYVLMRNGEDVPEKVSYIDYVQLESPAAEAGIRPGDVIISINGRVVTEMSHRSLIELIASCREMRMILIFENIRERIELAARAIRLRKLLHDKLYQLNQIDIEEQKILNRAYMRSQAISLGKNSLSGSLSSAATSSVSSFKSETSRTLRSTETTRNEISPATSKDSDVHADATETDLQTVIDSSCGYERDSISEDGENVSISSIELRPNSPSYDVSLRSSSSVELSSVIDSVALRHVLRLEDGDNNSVHITKL